MGAKKSNLDPYICTSSIFANWAIYPIPSIPVSKDIFTNIKFLLLIFLLGFCISVSDN